MTLRMHLGRRRFAWIVPVLLAGGLAACSGNKAALPAPGSVNADKFLYDRGTEALQNKKWLEAREYFKKLVDTYPQSQYRAEAKLGIGDSYLGEGRIESNILAANEFKEFLQYFPQHARDDYAQYRICVADARQMLSPQRDQTATHTTMTAVETFLKDYPDSDLKPQVLAIQRDARDRLSEHELDVGVFYFRTKWWPGAIDRLKPLPAADPNYAHIDEVYYYLAEALYRDKRAKEALPYYEKLVADYSKSKYAQKAKDRIADIKR
jgi:outer membrane protein assembly factor BamD